MYAVHSEPLRASFSIPSPIPSHRDDPANPNFRDRTTLKGFMGTAFPIRRKPPEFRNRAGEKGNGDGE